MLTKIISNSALQVKTTANGRNKWLLSKRNENIVADNVFYVFVHLHQLDNPSYFIVPSKVVANTISKGHQNWLNILSRKVETHIDNNLRTIEFDDNEYLNRWDYLD